MRASLVVCLGVSACVGKESPFSPVHDAASAQPMSADAASSDPREQGELTIGHCIDRATDAPCNDFEAAHRDFVELDSDTVVPQIIGLQGSPMFVLALRMIAPDQGLEARAPLIQLEVNLGTRFVGGYTARTELIVDPESSDHRIAPQLYVVTLLGDDAASQTVDVLARVSTDTEQEWSSHARFVIGALQGGP